MIIGKLTQRAARRIFAAVRQVEGMIEPSGAPRHFINRHPPQMLFAVRVTIDGGAAGSASADCSWTYTVKTDAGYLLGEEMTPTDCRLPLVPYVTTPNDSWGAGFFDKAGEFVLKCANECPQVGECPPTE